MTRYPRLVITLLVALSFVVAGCEHKPDGPGAGQGSATRSESVVPTKAEAAPRPEPNANLNPDEDAAAIIRQVFKAYGGEAAFSRWGCGYLRYKTKGGIVPAQLGEVTLEDTFQYPDYFKRVMHVDSGGNDLRVVFVTNHDKSWTKRGDGPTQEAVNKSPPRMEHPLAGFCNLAPLAGPEMRLTKLGVGEVEGKRAIGIRAGNEQNEQVDYHFDVLTGMLLKLTKLAPGPDPAKPSLLESFLGHYKTVGGGQVLTQIRGLQAGKVVLDVTLLNMRFVDHFDEKTFAKP